MTHSELKSALTSLLQRQGFTKGRHESFRRMIYHIPDSQLRNYCDRRLRGRVEADYLTGNWTEVSRNVNAMIQDVLKGL